jgi:UDP-N-acetyl-D-galactosamine dehydrogenase
MSERIAVVGLGYVGLPVAIGFGHRTEGTIGFDIDATRVEELQSGYDRTAEFTADEMASVGVRFTCDANDMKECTFYIVCVPTPITKNRQPNLNALRSASKTVAQVLKKGDIVVYESTVYPGVTEEVCGPILEELTGLVSGQDFFLGYSPERINPGDKEHTLERIVKVVAGQDEASLSRVADTYSLVVDAGVHRASSIRVAEAAKVIENTQRDLNIALMNELSILFDLLDIPTADVLAAAGTKWNFLKFTPGLVGGHCIGVDPYYLTAKAEEVGYHPQVILAGRRINDRMGKHLAGRLLKHLARGPRPLSACRVGIMGLTFKEDVPDTRNSRVPDIVDELREYGIEPVVDDAFAAPEDVARWGYQMSPVADWKDLDAIILAVPHRPYLEQPVSKLLSSLRSQGVFFDVKSKVNRADVPDDIVYLAL